MKWLVVLFTFLQGILDRLPSRKEAKLNRIQEIKDEIKKLQRKPGDWTAIDTGRYYTLTDELQKLERESANIGK